MNTINLSEQQMPAAEADVSKADRQPDGNPLRNTWTYFINRSGDVFFRYLEQHNWQLEDCRW